MFKLDHKLNPDEFIATFFEVNRQDHQRPPHPWEAIFREGKCSKEQLQGWAKERYYFTKQVPIKEYSILYNCPHVEVRRMWLPKAIEEEGEDLIGKSNKPHPEYWLDVCVGLGMDREYVRNSEPLYGVKFAVDSFANAAFKLHGYSASLYPKATTPPKRWRATSTPFASTTSGSRTTP
jgi:coenzyme PQQ biosynthesis protein C